MSRHTFVTLFCATAVFALGAGIQAAPQGATNNGVVIATTPIDLTTPASHSIPMLQTVVVRPDPSDLAAAMETHASAVAQPSVMLETAVEKAGDVIAGRVGGSVRRVGLAIPYYAFGGRPARAAE